MDYRHMESPLGWLLLAGEEGASGHDGQEACLGALSIGAILASKDLQERAMKCRCMAVMRWGKAGLLLALLAVSRLVLGVSLMKALVLALAFLPVCTFAQNETVLALEFGKHIRALIVENDRAAFSELPCFPSPRCLTWPSTLNYVFGSGDRPSSIRSFLRRPGIEMRLLGPYADGFGPNPGSHFIVVYYDPRLVDIEKVRYPTTIDHTALWLKGFVATSVDCQKGVCGFLRTPFYYGTELWWESGDYGFLHPGRVQCLELAASRTKGLDSTP